MKKLMRLISLFTILIGQNEPTITEAAITSNGYGLLSSSTTPISFNQNSGYCLVYRNGTVLNHKYSDDGLNWSDATEIFNNGDIINYPSVLLTNDGTKITFFGARAQGTTSLYVNILNSEISETNQIDCNCNDQVGMAIPTFYSTSDNWGVWSYFEEFFSYENTNIYKGGLGSQSLNGSMSYSFSDNGFGGISNASYVMNNTDDDDITTTDGVLSLMKNDTIKLWLDELAGNAQASAEISVVVSLNNFPELESNLVNQGTEPFTLTKNILL